MLTASLNQTYVEKDSSDVKVCQPFKITFAREILELTVVNC